MPSPLEVSAAGGALSVGAGGAPAIGGLGLRLRTEAGVVDGSLAPAGVEAARDPGGACTVARFRFVPSTAAGLEATLELRRYDASGVLVALLDYEGPPLAPRDGVRAVLRLDDFGRGFSVHRLKRHWTAPLFVSDYRLLGGASHLFLWRRARSPGHLLLAPLVGDGLVGELGVEDFELRIAASSHCRGHAPRRVPLFALAAGDDPAALPRALYGTAFAVTAPPGRLRWQKPVPELFRSLGWCSWNACGRDVSGDGVLSAAASLRASGVPLGFVTIDDGWLLVDGDRLAGHEADPAKFPLGLGAVARALREELLVPHVGVWHALQGYWGGVAPDSPVARSHELLVGDGGVAAPDPRGDAGRAFYETWYRLLAARGIDHVKVDNMSRHARFTGGRIPLADAGAGAQRNVEGAASGFFLDEGGGLGVLCCMAISLENVFAWRRSNVARGSDDFVPGAPPTTKEHLYQNAYNNYFLASFAVPDWDMFQSHDPHAEAHAFARAVSGGPIYVTDAPGRQRPELLRPLALADGRLLLVDEPAQVTPDLLYGDPAIEPIPLKVGGRVTRPGLAAAAIAAFHVNKTRPRVAGRLTLGVDLSAPGPLAVYRRKAGAVVVLDAARPELPFELDDYGAELFTAAPIEDGIAVLGLLDKYLGPAAVEAVVREDGAVRVRLREAGDLGLYVARPPRGVSVGDRALEPGAFFVREGLLVVPRAAFPPGVHEVTVRP